MQSILDRESFSRRLRTSLARCGLPDGSPTALAREFNRRFPGQPVTAQAARKWLHGESIPGQSRLLVLAQWLGVSADWLRFGGAAEVSFRAEEAAPLMDYELARDFSRLPPRLQEAVRHLVRNLLEEGS